MRREVVMDGRRIVRREAVQGVDPLCSADDSTSPGDGFGESPR